MIIITFRRLSRKIRSHNLGAHLQTIQRFTSGLYHFKVLYEFQWTAGTLRAGTSSIRKDLGQMGITGTKLGYGTNTHNGSSASEEGHTLKLDLVLCPLLPCHTKMARWRIQWRDLQKTFNRTKLTVGKNYCNRASSPSNQAQCNQGCRVFLSTGLICWLGWYLESRLECLDNLC